MTKARHSIKDSQSTLKTPLMSSKGHYNAYLRRRYIRENKRFIIVSLVVIFFMYFVIFFVAIPAHLDNKPSLVLIESEVKQIVVADKELKDATAQYDLTLQATHNTQLRCEDTLASVGNQRIAGTRKLIAERDYNALIARLQQAHSCLGCELAKDSKSFIQQEGKGKQ
jgi:hypothetical protein